MGGPVQCNAVNRTILNQVLEVRLLVSKLSQLRRLLNFGTIEVAYFIRGRRRKVPQQFSVLTSAIAIKKSGLWKSCRLPGGHGSGEARCPSERKI